MKKVLYTIVLLFICSCVIKETKKQEQVINYYKGFENSNYKQLKKTISDSLIITEGDYITSFTSESFYEQFKWDSIFKPVYNLLKLENEDEHIIATVSVRSIRFDFLKNNPLTCRHKFYFKSGKIKRIENLECLDANWGIWEKERDSLVKWIKINHPKLDGFIHDLSQKGAVDYVKAIDLYKNR